MKQLPFSVLGALLVTGIEPMSAQWIQTTIPADSYIGALAVSGSNIFVGGSFGSSKGVYVSSDDGVDWAQSSDTGIQIITVNALAVKDSFIFAGTNGHVLSSFLLPHVRKCFRKRFD